MGFAENIKRLREEQYMQDDLYALSRAVCASNRKLRRILYLDRSPLFFSPTGDYVTYNSYVQYLRSVSMDALGRKVTPHTLRHTHASLLAEQAIDDPKITLDFIRRRLGHADSRITSEIYIHVTEKKRATENSGIKSVHLF